jgi:hypothetical protein
LFAGEHSWNEWSTWMSSTVMAPSVPLEARQMRQADLLQTMRPLAGSRWLAVDRATLCHWVVDAVSIIPARGNRYTSAGRGVNPLVTVCSGSGEPTFVIESHDTLRWIEPHECLEIREGRFRGSVIVLHRLDQIDAPTIGRAALERLPVDEPVRAIRLSDDRYLEIPACLLPTGISDVDQQLVELEETLVERQCLAGPPDGTTSVLLQIARQLDALARVPELSSFVWIVVLREQISRLASPLHR